MKRILSLILAVAVLASVTALAYGGNVIGKTVRTVGAWKDQRQEQTDPGYLADQWAQPELAQAKEADLIPEAMADQDLTRPITRREYAATAVALFDQLLKLNPGAEVLEIDAAVPEGGQWPFADVEDEAVTLAYRRGLVEGVGGGRFDPDGTLTREQAATILNRILLRADYTVPEASGPVFGNLTDADSISDWAREGVSLMVDLDVIQGKPNGAGGVMFDPQGTLTGQEALVMNGRLASAAADLDQGARQSEGSFNADFFAAVDSDEPNKSLSPVSARYALGLLRAGAEGETRAQLDRLLSGVDFSQWKHILQSSGGPTVEVANSIWFDLSVIPDAGYLNTLKKTFDATSKTLALNTRGAMQTINRWVSDKTHGLIDSILDAPMSDDAAAVVLNALYFKGDWTFPFDAADTYDQPFHNGNGTDSRVPFMHDTRRGMQYISTGDCVGAALPYDGGELPGLPQGADPTATYPTNDGWWMLVLMPRNGADAESLAAQDFGSLLKSAKDAYVRISLPKFTVEGSYDLTRPLMDLGLTAAFTGKDFGPMGTCEKGPIALSKVVQKTYLRVDEKGTEAAAVTGGFMEATSAINPDTPIELTFDRPFLCCLWNDQIAQPLFLTAVNELH